MINWTRFLVVGLLVLAWLTSWADARAQTVEYIHTDALGTPVAVTNAAGQVIERSEYEPYGKLLNRPLTDGPGFTGHVQDAATGLTYMQQRYYDPDIGGMLSVDPVTAYEKPLTNFCRYCYARNNPYKFTDPDGRESATLITEHPMQVEWTPEMVQATAQLGAIVYSGSVLGAIRAVVGVFIRQEAKSEQPNPSPGNSNPYDGPVDDPVTVVDSDGNAIPVGRGEQISSSPDGRYQQVKDSDGKATGTRLDKGGHKTHSDPKAQGPHGHRPSVKDDQGNPHLPLNEPKPPPEPKL